MDEATTLLGVMVANENDPAAPMDKLLLVKFSDGASQLVSYRNLLVLIAEKETANVNDMAVITKRTLEKTLLEHAKSICESELAIGPEEEEEEV